MTIYERESLISIFGLGIGKRERVVETGKVIHIVEEPDLRDNPEGSWHGHYLVIIDSDTVGVGRLENILYHKEGKNLKLSFRMVPGYKLQGEQINENPICKRRIRWDL